MTLSPQYYQRKARRLIPPPPITPILWDTSGWQFHTIMKDDLYTNCDVIKFSGASARDFEYLAFKGFLMISSNTKFIDDSTNPTPLLFLNLHSKFWMKARTSMLLMKTKKETTLLSDSISSISSCRIPYMHLVKPKEIWMNIISCGNISQSSNKPTTMMLMEEPWSSLRYHSNYTSPLESIKLWYRFMTEQLVGKTPKDDHETLTDFFRKMIDMQPIEMDVTEGSHITPFLLISRLFPSRLPRQPCKGAISICLLGPIYVRFRSCPGSWNFRIYFASSHRRKRIGPNIKNGCQIMPHYRPWTNREFWQRGLKARLERIAAFFGGYALLR